MSAHQDGAEIKLTLETILLETAPRDGRPIDLWGSEQGWRENRPASLGHRRLASCRYDRQGQLPGCGWYGFVTADGRRVDSATHWMPLPAPPEQGS